MMKQPVDNSLFRNPNAPISERVNDLFSKMTLEEKVAQLQAVTGWDLPVSDRKFDSVKAAGRFPFGVGHWGWPQNFAHDAGGFNPLPLTEMVAGTPSPVGARGVAEATNTIQKWMIENTRLGIPVLFHVEALHGMGIMEATSFPQAIALAASWDPDLVRETFEVSAREGRRAGITQALSPNADVARDPRWGRIEETYGEDSFLVSRMIVAATRGFQGEEIGPDSVLATLKHLIGYSKPTGGRNLASVEAGERELRSEFLPPFEAGIREASAACVMAAYNEVDGIPCHANKWLLTKVLRDEWGFNGLVMADYAGIANLHGMRFVTGSLRDSMKLSFDAGVDVELPDVECAAHLADLVAQGEVDQDRFDRAVKAVLELKFRVGLFETPYVDPAQAELTSNCAAHKAVALRAAESSIVLLQNRGGILPLDPARIKRLAVVGPNAAVGHIGGYGGWPAYVVDPLSGIRSLVGNRVEIVYAEGVRGSDLDVNGRPCPADRETEEKRIAEALAVVAGSDAVIFCLGENEKLCGEGYDSHDLKLPGMQLDLVRQIAAMGLPMVAVLINGRPLVVGELCDLVPGVVEAFYLGQEGGHAITNVLFGKVNPGGRLPVSFPRHAGCVPLHYNLKPGSRGNYVFQESTPLFPFGHGLSYTKFEYLGIRTAVPSVHAGEDVNVLVTVSNAGGIAGDEVVQVYLQDRVSSVTRPERELCAFSRVRLEPGETREVSLTIPARSFGCWNREMQFVIEPGELTLHAGASSGHTPLRCDLQILD